MQFPLLCLKFRGMSKCLFVNNFNNITSNFDACILNIQDYRKHVVANRIFICILEKRRDKQFFLHFFFSRLLEIRNISRVGTQHAWSC